MSLRMYQKNMAAPSNPVREPLVVAEGQEPLDIQEDRNNPVRKPLVAVSIDLQNHLQAVQ